MKYFNTNKKRLLAIPIITILLLSGGLVPRVETNEVINAASAIKGAIVQIYNGSNEVQAASTNMNTVDKSYKIKIYIDSVSNPMQFPTGMGAPFIALGRTFVPYRIMVESLGATVGWLESSQKVTATNTDNTVSLFIGSQNYTVNGVTKNMDIEPFILSGENRTYIPARYITEGLGYTIDAIQNYSIMYICVFTKGQTEDGRKAALAEIVADSGAAPVVTVGQLTEAQIEQVKGKIDDAYTRPITFYDLKTNKGYADFCAKIKNKLGNDAIIESSLTIRDSDGDNYIFVVMPNDDIVKVGVETGMDGTNYAIIIGEMPNMKLQ